MQLSNYYNYFLFHELAPGHGGSDGVRGRSPGSTAPTLHPRSDGLELARGGNKGEKRGRRCPLKYCRGSGRACTLEVGSCSHCGTGSLALVVPDGPVTFMKEFFVVAAGSLGK